jgi:DNA-binding transcriptional LysR family regulator
MDHVNLAVDSMLARLLLPALPPFLAANAGITLSVATFCARQRDIGEADLSFGFTRPERGRRRIRRLAELTMSMAASSACREGERSVLPVWSFRDGVWLGRQVSGTGSTELHITHLEDVATLVRDGFGTAMLPDYMIGGYSGLVRFDSSNDEARQSVLPVWMSLLETSSRSSAVRAVAAICCDVIQANLPPARVDDDRLASIAEGERE